MLKKKLLTTICACSTLVLTACPLFAATSGTIKDLPQEKQQALLQQLGNYSTYENDCVINETAKISTKLSKLPAAAKNNKELLAASNMNVNMKVAAKYDKDSDTADENIAVTTNLPKEIGNFTLNLDLLMQNTKTPQKSIIYLNLKDLKLPTALTKDADAASILAGINMIKGNFIKLDINSLIQQDADLKNEMQQYLSNPDLMNSYRTQIFTALKPYLAAGKYTVDGNNMTLTFDVKNPKNFIADLLKSVDTTKVLGDLKTKLPAGTTDTSNFSAADINKALASNSVKFNSVKFVVSLTDNKITGSNAAVNCTVNIPDSQKVTTYTNKKVAVKSISGYKIVKTKKGKKVITTKQPIYKTTYTNKKTTVKTVNIPLNIIVSADTTVKYQDVTVTAPTTAIDASQLLTMLGK